ncbi:aspartate ammonia-lyase [Ensifer sp. ENS04]|uniref:aspartate ammonia-lyase n=1 Tax=Ensifer sp. ENS04 TaxID=2769281 RepID=UPI00177C1776|nr:aspartate ammonia-lyase [Ensifer sp. ENS04]MBD9544770.1 aspartate ammonia-lyase [Ensifer sp. ENS04]
MEYKTLRVEADSLGQIIVPESAYWGPQTARAVTNFPLSGVSVGSFHSLIKSLAQVKLACARVNARTLLLEPRIADAIQSACADIIAGTLNSQFPIDVFQGGAGTSTNMNMNEVVANRALEHLGLMRGRYDVVHPNDHVNMAQSTNDVYPTAIRVALISESSALAEALLHLATAFEVKGEEFAGISKLGRTQLQDAVPMTLGQEFQGFATTLREDVIRLAEIAKLLHEVNLGGTAIGTGLNAGPVYSVEIVPELARVTGLPLVRADNLVEACWDTGAFVLFSAMLKRTAIKLSKISSDLRLLSSGPRGGLGEINLPALQPGSSIMPGKVNPVMPEVINQIAFFVAGADVTVTMAAEAGQLQLNVMEPVIAYSLLNVIGLLARGIEALRTSCVEGITANPAACEGHLQRSTALVTALVPHLGYDTAAEIAKRMLAEGITLSEVLPSPPTSVQAVLSAFSNSDA